MCNRRGRGVCNTFLVDGDICHMGLVENKYQEAGEGAEESYKMYLMLWLWRSVSCLCMYISNKGDIKQA